MPLIWVDSFPFIRLGPDEWLRPTYFQDAPWPRGDSPWPQTNYTLVRVVNATGDPHPVYWPLFLKHMKEQYSRLNGIPDFLAGTDTWRSPAMLRSKATDNWCQLKCEILFSCSICLSLCSLWPPA